MYRPRRLCLDDTSIVGRDTKRPLELILKQPLRPANSGMYRLPYFVQGGSIHLAIFSVIRRGLTSLLTSAANRTFGRELRSDVNVLK